MSTPVIHQQKPFVVPTGDGKLIEEHFGKASVGNEDRSVAHMVAPPHWTEPTQQPDFDEYTLVVRGRIQVDLEGETIVVGAGESILVPRGTSVRYGNPFREESEYWAVCIPAFTPERAHRRED